MFQNDIPIDLRVAFAFVHHDLSLLLVIEPFAEGRACFLGRAVGSLSGFDVGLVELGPFDLTLDGDVDVGGYAEGRCCCCC